LPHLLVQVQYRPCLGDKLRVTCEYPAAILPRFDGIFTQPSPNSDATDTGNNPLFQNVPLQFFKAETRQWNAKSRWELACQRLNRHDDPGGKTGRAARIWVDRSGQASVLQKTFFAICSQFAGEHQIWLQFCRYLAPLRLKGQFWHVKLKSTVPYTSAPFVRASLFQFRSKLLGMGFSAAYPLPFEGRLCHT